MLTKTILITALIGALASPLFAAPTFAQTAQSVIGPRKQDPKYCNANNAVDPWCLASQWRSNGGRD